jgi:hypothetical protein
MGQPYDAAHALAAQSGNWALSEISFCGTLWAHRSSLARGGEGEFDNG